LYVKKQITEYIFQFLHAKMLKGASS